MNTNKLSRRSLAKSSLFVPVAAYGAFGASRLLAEPYEDDAGVASGCPTESTIVLWTRVPARGRPGGLGSLEVSFEVSTDESFGAATIVARGRVGTSEARDFTVKTLVEGLQPFTTYHYRFTTETGYASVVGRTKTAPARGQATRPLRFAAVGCQQFSQGHYGAYLALAREDVDYCIHTGDHIYEQESGDVRRVGTDEAKTLADYRRKHRLYLSDPAWREVRRLYPFIDIWDDHEVFNDYAGATDRAADTARFTGAYQAYLEYMPLMTELTRGPNGEPEAKWYRSFKFGDLVELVAMDQRQYRTPCPCSRRFVTPGCDDLRKPGHTMLGDAQKRWVKDTLGASTSKWKLLLSEVMVAPLRIGLGERGGPEAAVELWGEQTGHDPEAAGMLVNLDGWDGYPSEREELLSFVAREELKNVVVVTGDIHAAANAYLYEDPARRAGDGTALEIVTTSISSKTLGSRLGGVVGGAAGALIRRANPHLAWTDIRSNGYAILTVSEQGIDVRHVVVDRVDRLSANVSEGRRTRIADGVARFV